MPDILDPTLKQIVEDDLRVALIQARLIRQRGGISRNGSWAEMSGRASNGSWVELRLHHKESRLQVTLLEYQTISAGGKTIVVGEQSLAYVKGPEEVKDSLVAAIQDWLSKLSNN